MKHTKKQQKRLYTQGKKMEMCPAAQATKIHDQDLFYFVSGFSYVVFCLFRKCSHEYLFLVKSMQSHMTCWRCEQ